MPAYDSSEPKVRTRHVGRSRAVSQRQGRRLGPWKGEARPAFNAFQVQLFTILFDPAVGQCATARAMLHGMHEKQRDPAGRALQHLPAQKAACPPLRCPPRQAGASLHPGGDLGVRGHHRRPGSGNSRLSARCSPRGYTLHGLLPVPRPPRLKRKNALGSLPGRSSSKRPV